MNKLSIVFLVFLVIFGVILYKLFSIQVLQSEKYALSQYLKLKKIPATRGGIFDRNHEPLAINITNYKLFLEPKKIKEPDKMILKLEETLKLGTATVEALVKSDKDWIKVKDGLTADQKNQINALKLSGIGFEDQPTRYYPEGSLSSHITGFIGKNYNGEDVAQGGIEGYYNKDLSGMPGILKSERDGTDNAIFSGTQIKIDPEPGRNVVLTIDKTIQMKSKEKLKNAVEKYNAKSGCIIVADPNNMELLAMSCLPDYDPTNYSDYDYELFNNPSITSLYEPGSIFKPLVMASALYQKAIKPDEKMMEDGPVTVGDYVIRNWNNKYEGELTMSRILEKSSNIGMNYVGSKLGNKKLLDAINSYGFSQKTNIDLSGETEPLLKSVPTWYPIDYSTATFGQGITVTPIQMITAFASLINGGELLEPHIVKEFEQNGKVTKVAKKIVGKPIDTKTSAIMKTMLENVVNKGEVKWNKPEGYRIGGKTGTAEIAVSGKYGSSKTNASFIGFGPVDKPRFVILVIIKEPEGSIWGSETAAPVFFEVAKEVLFYYNIAPN